MYISTPTNSTPPEKKILQKLPYRIISVTSEAESFSVRELLNHTPFSPGWQSSRFCSYPQEILIEFPSLIHLKEIQFLSHQYKIPNKIEIHIDFNNKIQKVGYLSLDSNERSNFQARELKTVYLNYNTQKVLIKFLGCHTNHLNIYAQIGLIALSFLGDFNSFSNENNTNEINHLEDELIYDPVTLKRLKDLNKAKNRAIELEDFEEAKKIKNAIDSLKSVSKQLILLEERKNIAIKNDDFDAAQLIKYEIDRIRNAVSNVSLNNNNNNFGSLNKNNFYNNFEGQNRLDEINRNKFNNNDNNINNNNINDRQKIFMNGNENYMKINSEYEMDKDDDIYRIRNNINTGNYLQSPPKPNFNENDNNIINTNSNKYTPINTNNNINNFNNNINNKNNNINTGGIGPKKNIIDVDNIRVGGITKDFTQMVEEQLKNSPENNEINPNNEAKYEGISAENFKSAEPFIPILSNDIVASLFSKNWVNVKEGFDSLNSHITNFPNDPLLNNKSESDIVIAVLGVCSYVLQSSLSQSLIYSMDMIKNLFNKFHNVKIEDLNTFDIYSNDCIRLIIEHLGDNNIKLKEKSENTLLEFANFYLIKSKVIFEHLIHGQIKKTLNNSAKHLAGRYNFLNRLINNFGYNENEVPLNDIMNYAIKGYMNSQNVVREAALNVIVSVYKFAGDKIRSFFNVLRPAQINTIENALDGVDGLNEQITNENNINTNENNFVNNEDNLMNSQSQMFMPKDTNNLNDEEHTCQFCGCFNPNWNSDQIEIHQFKECPMLIPCFKCNQIVEIKDLNYHYMNECQFKSEFKIHPKCKEPVLKVDYDNHDKDNNCNPFKSPNLCNRCPLCHMDITPAGNVGWEVHLLQQTCPNNPRSNQ